MLYFSCFPSFFQSAFTNDQLWLKNRIETCFPASDIFQEKVYRGFGNQFPVIVECRELDRKTLADQPVVTADDAEVVRHQSAGGLQLLHEDCGDIIILRNDGVNPFFRKFIINQTAAGIFQPVCFRGECPSLKNRPFWSRPAGAPETIQSLS